MKFLCVWLLVLFVKQTHDECEESVKGMKGMGLTPIPKPKIHDFLSSIVCLRWKRSWRRKA